jgi:hypothetical protein
LRGWLRESIFTVEALRELGWLLGVLGRDGD